MARPYIGYRHLLCVKICTLPLRPRLLNATAATVIQRLQKGHTLPALKGVGHLWEA